MRVLIFLIAVVTTAISYPLMANELTINGIFMVCVFFILTLGGFALFEQNRKKEKKWVIKRDDVAHIEFVCGKPRLKVRRNGGESWFL